MIDWFFSTEFASRATGTCGGWSMFLAVAHAVADCLIWVPYVAIPLLMLRRVFHVRRKSLAEGMFGLFVIFCGFLHGLMAFCNFIPVYNALLVWKALTAIVSWSALIVIAMDIDGASGGDDIIGGAPP